MCFDLDSHPPIAPIAGGALDSSELVLQAADGTRFQAFRARASTSSGAGVVILPDVRGLHPFFEELALRFAENGIDALAIDYFGRTAGGGSREHGFDYMPHVNQTGWTTLGADIRAAAEHLRMANEGRVSALFTIGFCFGGRLSFLSSTLGLGLAGAVGFYGMPVGPGRNDIPAPVDLVDQMANPILAIFGGADPAIPAEAIAQFEAALERAGVEHRVVVYPDAPHSFFDRKADEFADASRQAWEETITFIRGHTPNWIAGES
ncbi:MAG TPA: dienelactone hydrolase family protein [Candidatus Limnocylindrales bacterium]|jgi:carboxymethylenebutenolidase|nr:dienelactone hydrolase family protein [Candidatus Limnocylindrales bacterium]